MTTKIIVQQATNSIYENVQYEFNDYNVAVASSFLEMATKIATRNKSTMPNYMIRYLVPYGIFFIKEIPDFAVKQQDRNRKDEIKIEQKKFSISFTTQEPLKAQTAKDSPHLLIGTDTNVDIVGFQSFDHGQGVSMIFQSEQETLQFIERFLTDQDILQRSKSSQLPLMYIKLHISPATTNHESQLRPVAPSQEEKQVVQMIFEKIHINHMYDHIDKMKYNLFNFATLESWSAVLVTGLNSKFSRRFFQKLEQSAVEEQDKLASRLQMQEQVLVLSQKLQIAYDKFKKKTWNRLTTKEKQVVDEIFKLGKTTEMDFSPELSEALRFSNRPKVKYLLGKKANVCEHLKEMGESFLNGSEVPLDEIQRKFGVQIDYSIYCNKCGEKIGEINDEDIAIATVQEYSSSVDTSLEKDIYYSVANIIAQYTAFTNEWQTKVKQIQKIIMSNLGPVLDEIHGALIRTKSLKEDMDAVFDIYIAAYTFALLAHVINTFSGKIAFKSVKGGAVSVVAKKEIEDQKKVVQIAGRLLVQHKRVELMNNNIVNMQNVVDVFAQAYHWAITVELIEPRAIVRIYENPLDEAIQKAPSKELKHFFKEFEPMLHEHAEPMSPALQNFQSTLDTLKSENILHWKRGKRDRAISILKDSSIRQFYDYDKNIQNRRNFKAVSPKLFFSLFEFRCPLGELHEFGDSNACVKCKATPEILKNKDKQYMERYEKQYVEYERARNQLIESELSTLFQMKAPKKHTAKTTPTTRAQANVELASLLSKRIDIPLSILLNLGFLENLNYEDVQAGKVQPQKTEIGKNELLHLKNYILQVKRLYNLSRNMTHVRVEIPKHYESLFEDVNRKQLAEMKPLPEDFDISKLVEDRNSLINVLCKLLMTCIDNYESNEALKAFGLKFGKTIALEIVETEKLMADFTLKHIKSSAAQVLDTSREDFDMLMSEEKDEGGDDTDIEAEDKGAEEATMADLDYDEDIEEDHFEVNIEV
jgi:ribosomal protein S20